ncbi:hypothetical protein ACF08M_14205 [Streptomyces sp. NPDC015032]|uniref:hypothetical protein n=1 Tax=Streptomyces sp. NPDC015032 TaxID=3364937 RepID=UPI0036FC9449
MRRRIHMRGGPEGMRPIGCPVVVAPEAAVITAPARRPRFAGPPAFAGTYVP